ncbi:hypothetical protein [Pseudogemmobacter bohemicus]|uniref:hypothetical protein n=1 Tax=Pseudogemmobacter bohemicus TaxID=2250708 RepID=UPI000DD3C810|nr:hypothetical protein [Pseudogemmobacter bohemicus]
MRRLLPLIGALAPAPAFAADMACDIRMHCLGARPLEICRYPGPTKSMLLTDYAGETPAVRIADEEIALRPVFPKADGDQDCIPRTISFTGSAASGAEVSVFGMISKTYIYVRFEEAASKSTPKRSVLGKCRILDAGAEQ